MKAHHYVCLLSLPLRLWAQGTLEAPRIADAGLNHRVLSWNTVEGEAGNEIVLPHEVIELGDGLHWLNPLTGRYEESVEALEITREGYAVARQGQHKVIVAPDLLETPAVDLEMPGLDGQAGRRLRTSPRFLSFFDRISGKTVLLGQVKSCAGELAAPNVIVFSDAFDGTVKAAIRYTYAKSSWEQDLILYGDVGGSPEDWDLDPASTLVELYSECFDAPTPRRVRQVLADGLEDERLEFETMTIGDGIAYVLGQGAESVEVSKTWAELDGRHFIVESIPYLKLCGLLERAGLAKKEGSQKTLVEGKAAQGREGLVRLVAAKAKESRGTRLMAGIRPPGTMPQSGVVLDYRVDLAGGGPTGGVFRSDTTYNITDHVTISTGTAVFEAGTCIKSAAGKKLTVNVPVTWKSAQWRPIIFSSKDDDSCGEIVPGSTHTPSGWYADTALYLDSGCPAFTLSHAAVRYATTGITVKQATGQVLKHVQFVNCRTAVNPISANFKLLNGLVWNESGWTTDTKVFGGSGSVGQVEHLTVDTATWLNYSSTLTTFNLVNSILFGVQNLGNYTLFTAVQQPGTSPFVAEKAGVHYLGPASPFRNAGVTTIDSGLAADLKQMTTYPPITLTGVPSYPLGPQAQRDLDTPDLAYHYAPLDWLCSQISPGMSTVTITLTNGVAVGLYGNYGFSLVENNTFISEGAPGAMNRIVWYPSVQEQPVRLNNVAVGSRGMFYVGGATYPYQGVPKPIIKLRFTDLVGLGKRQTFFDGGIPYPYLLNTVSLTDCWLRGIDLTISSSLIQFLTGNPVPAVTLQNNLVERGTVSLWNGAVYYYGTYYQNPLAANLYNNLFWNSSLTLTYNDTGATYHPNWYVKDNLFDTATISFTGNGSYTNYVGRSNNRFSNTPTGTQLESSPVNLTALSYATGAFGPWYIGSSTPTLVDQGSRTAAGAGLYHHTLFTGTGKDASQVDVGFHQVAVNASNQPQDSDGDGLPDYLEDRDGDGVPDFGETNWQQSENGTTGVPGLQVFTYLE